MLNKNVSDVFLTRVGDFKGHARVKQVEGWTRAEREVCVLLSESALPWDRVASETQPVGPLSATQYWGGATMGILQDPLLGNPNPLHRELLLRETQLEKWIF